MIDSNLDNAVTFRRRDWEQVVMMRELCKRNGVTLPHEQIREFKRHKNTKVFVIHNASKADGIRN
eukprot:COSAG01_NODE_69517_length_261_cov_0.635802_1_plen_64_part_10